MNEKRHYRRVFQAFTEKPWAILPTKLTQIAEILVRRADGQHLTDEEIERLIEAESYAAKSRASAKQGAAVAVIPIYGVITPRADIFTKMSGGTGMDQFMAAMNQAANDPNVSSILLDVDSPGGQVDLVPEAAAVIRSARQKKPVTAVANTMAASAAYWLASQASELVVTPSGEVGSIGVFAAHQDISKAEEMMGVKTTLISAGKYKTELSPFAPLTEDALQAAQENVNEYYGMFTRDVAAGRRAQVAKVRSSFGEGRMVTAQAAVEQGMADRVDTYESTLARMLGSVTSNTTARVAMTTGDSRTAEGLSVFIGGGDTPLQITAGTTITETVYKDSVPAEEAVTEAVTDEMNATNEDTEPTPDSEKKESSVFVFNNPPFTTTGTSTNSTNFVIYGNNGQTVIESSETFSEESDSPEVEEDLDGNPQALADLRKQAKETAISEHENYLDLLRRMKK